MPIDHLSIQHLLSVAALGFFVSLLANAFLVLTKRYHGRFTLDGSEGVQKFHEAPTPRIGGAGLLAGILAVCGALVFYDGFKSQSLGLLMPLMVAGAPAFLAGLIEDFTKSVSVRVRLLATLASGLLVCVLTGQWVNHVGVPGLDFLLSIAPIGILFTAFCIAGVSNSINIIDGFNGLSSGVVVLAMSTLAFIAYRVGDHEVLILALCSAAVVLGFMCVNFPRGYIFLGDAGAYSLGYYLSALSVMLTMRNPGEVSPWAMLLVVGYPVIETLFSVYRRISRRRRHSPGAPDASHLHSLVYRRVVSRKLLIGAPAWKRNAATSPILWVYAFVPMLGAILWPESLLMVLVWFVLSFVVYLKFYQRMLRMSFFTQPRAQSV